MSLYACPLTALFLCYYQGKTDCKMCFYSLTPISLLLFSHEPSSINHCILFLHKTATVVVKNDLHFVKFNVDFQQSSHLTWRQYLMVGHFQFLQSLSSFGFSDASIIYFLISRLLVDSPSLFHLFVYYVSKLSHQNSPVLNLYP